MDVKPKVLFLSGDLIFAGRVRAACQSAGFDFYFGGSLPPAPEEDAPRGHERYVILDLSTRSGILESLPAEARAAYPEARLIAYAPHVQKERLVAARKAGYDQVMTRGQFDSWIAALGT